MTPTMKFRAGRLLSHPFGSSSAERAEFLLLRDPLALARPDADWLVTLWPSTIVARCGGRCSQVFTLSKYPFATCYFFVPWLPLILGENRTGFRTA